MNGVSTFSKRRKQFVNASEGSFGGQAVADAGLGEDQRRASVRLELGPQPAHVDADVFGFGLIPGAPDAAQELGVREELPPVVDELPQERELGRREMEGL